MNSSSLRFFFDPAALRSSYAQQDFISNHVPCRLGYAWQCCGLIYARTSRPNLGFAAYSKALENYKFTVGSLYHRTANVYGKIAEHYESLSQFEAAE